MSVVPVAPAMLPPVAAAGLSPVVPAVMRPVAAAASFVQVPLLPPAVVARLLAARSIEAPHALLLALAPGVLQQPVVRLPSWPAAEGRLAAGGPTAPPACVAPAPAVPPSLDTLMESDLESFFDWLPPLESLEAAG